MADRNFKNAFKGAQKLDRNGLGGQLILQLQRQGRVRPPSCRRRKSKDQLRRPPIGQSVGQLLQHNFVGFPYKYKILIDKLSDSTLLQEKQLQLQYLFLPYLVTKTSFIKTVSKGCHIRGFF